MADDKIFRVNADGSTERVTDPELVAAIVADHVDDEWAELNGVNTPESQIEAEAWALLGNHRMGDVQFGEKERGNKLLLDNGALRTHYDESGRPLPYVDVEFTSKDARDRVSRFHALMGGELINPTTVRLHNTTEG